MKSCRFDGGSAREEPGIGRGRGGLRVAQTLPALRGELDGVGARVFLGALAMDQAAPKQPANNIGKRRPVDSGALDQLCLGEALFLGDGGDDGELARREPARIGLCLRRYRLRIGPRDAANASPNDRDGLPGFGVIAHSRVLLARRAIVHPGTPCFGRSSALFTTQKGEQQTPVALTQRRMAFQYDRLLLRRTPQSYWSGAFALQDAARQRKRGLSVTGPDWAQPAWLWHLLAGGLGRLPAVALHQRHLRNREEKGERQEAERLEAHPGVGGEIAPDRLVDDRHGDEEQRPAPGELPPALLRES